MRITAILGTLTPEVARFVGLEPEEVSAVGHHIDLTSEFRDPEAVDDVDGTDVNAHGAAGGDDKFVPGGEGARASDLLAGVFKFKPPLVTGRGDFVGVGLAVLGHIVGVPDAFEGGDRDDDEGQDGGADKAELNERVAMALLGWDGFFLGLGLSAEFQGRVRQHATDEDENDQRHPAGDVKHLKLGAGHWASHGDGGLVSIHAPEVVIATGEEGEGAEGKAGAAPTGGGGEEGRQAHGAFQ